MITAPQSQSSALLRRSYRGALHLLVAMAEDGIRHLRVLIANEKRERLEVLAQVVAGLGHEVIAREIYVKEVGAVTARERPDVALVGLGLHSEHALELISEIVREASCPVIALLSATQHNGHKLVDVAQAIVDSHLLLLPSLAPPATPPERPA